MGSMQLSSSKAEISAKVSSCLAVKHSTLIPKTEYSNPATEKAAG
jgi:hypothetical protein